jgi:predicted RNase H-like HicB family nuclease
MKYPVYIEKDKDSDFGVLVSDLPGCYSAGSTMEEALTNAEEAILTHLEGLMMDNDPIPLPSKVDEFQSKQKDRNGVWALVEVDLKNHRNSTESIIKWIQNQLSE